MSQDKIIEVIGRDGWRKEFPLQKTIVFIGSDPQADIPLESGAGGGVAPRHLQVIASPEVGYRLVNLGDSEVFLGPTGERGLAPRFSTELADGTQIKVGDFTLVFRGEMSSGSATQPGGASRQSQHLGLRVSLPQKQIAPHRTLEGVITVSNLGDHPGAHLELELEGLADDYFELEPGPLLSSGAEKEVFFRLYHRGTKPLAGDYRLIISVAAPKAYPAEQVSVAQVVSFLPLYEHKLTLTPVGGKPSPEKPAEVKESPITQPEPTLSTVSPPSPKETVKEPGSSSVWGEPPPPPVPIILVEPPASPPPQPEPLPAVVVESPASEPPEPSPSQTLPAAEPLPVAPSRPAGSPPASGPGAVAEWWEETSSAGAAPAQKAATPAGADWWAAPETAPARPASRPAMKLKATAETPDKGATGDQPAATEGDWWTSPPEPAPPAESPKKQKTKAKKQD